MTDLNEEELEQRLEALGQSVPVSSNLTARVMTEIENEIPGAQSPDLENTYIKRWIMRGIGIAASVGIVAFIWTALVSSPQRAYGLQDVRQQFAALRSLHVVGKGADGAPWEVYVERPDRCYRVQAGHRIIQTAAKNMVIDDQGKTAIILPGDALDARFLVESTLQTELLTALVGPPDEKSRKIRVERVGDVESDVYESIEDQGAGGDKIRREVFLNPRTGLPVKAMVYLKQADGTEQTIAAIDRIEANGPAPSGAFDLAAPAGYQLQQLPEQAAKAAAQRRAPAFGGAHTDNLHLELSYIFQLDDKAMLVCWSLFDSRNPKQDLSLPAPDAFTLTGQKGTYDLHPLRADETPDGHHWRWALIVPSDPKLSLQQNEPSMNLKVDRATLSLTMHSVKFEPAELERFVVEAQQRTLPAEGKPLTLDQIRESLKKFLPK